MPRTAALTIGRQTTESSSRLTVPLHRRLAARQRCRLPVVSENAQAALGQATFGDVVSWLGSCRALPDDVEASARLLLLDTFGCILAGLRHGEVGQFGRALAM